MSDDPGQNIVIGYERYLLKKLELQRAHSKILYQRMIESEARMREAEEAIRCIDRLEEAINWVLGRRP